MNFCPECETYLTTQILNNDNTNKILSYKCNNCSYSKIVDIGKEPEYKCVYQQNYNLKKIKIDQKNIQFLSKDATLPHVNNITCPNQKCLTNKENDKSEVLTFGETKDLDSLTSGIEKIDINNTNKINNNDVVYIKLNESDLTYLYQCCNCKHTWTNK
jgi:hypothetical protein